MISELSNVSLSTLSLNTLIVMFLITVTYVVHVLVRFAPEVQLLYVDWWIGLR